MAHKSGFVNIIGKPNVGKSTLMNALVGERLSIITSKAQTTRHRILGIVNGKDFQIVFSDTPGIIKKPKYELHKAMMQFVSTSLEDADIVLYLTDVFQNPEDEIETLKQLETTDIPKILALNKIDLKKEKEIDGMLKQWRSKTLFSEIQPISALQGGNIDKLFQLILKYLPENPAYYPKDALTDKPERYFVAEIIREKIFLNYRQEVPYATEVGITAFQEDEDIIRIAAEIYVERKSQKAILIGKGGLALKTVGTEARKDIEQFLGKKVYLELHVKVKEKWRDNPNLLRNLGYNN